ncbi:MAG: response regulator [Planctomycetes bacterium]|nr:response regulator [Planctomycetota bacterium]
MKILIVDDSSFFKKNLVRMLEKLGHESISLDSGNECLEQITSLQVDVILMDWNMPGLSGLETLIELGKQEVETPVIMMTAQSDMDQIMEAMDNNAHDYIIKPFEAESLAEKLDSLP